LPAIFIYHDLQFDFIGNVKTHFRIPKTKKVFCKEINSHSIDKYYSGTALLLFPFFCTAHSLSLLGNYSADGYSELYQYAVTFAALIFLLIGCYFVLKILDFYSATQLESIVVLLITVFGTNLVYYAISEPSLSHVYSFCMIAGFIFYIKKSIISTLPKYIIISSIILGIIILIRPVNVMVISVIPFLTEKPDVFLKWCKKIIQMPLILLLAGIIVFSIISIQFILNFYQTGVFFVWAYQDEGFVFSNPQFFNVLFSYAKGLFIYTPIIFISLLSLIYVFKQSSFQLFGLMLFLFIITYVISSWWTWQYGMSFGHRIFIDFYFIVSVMLLFTIRLINNKIWKEIFITIGILAITVNNIQAYQYRNYILLWMDMDKEKYWQVFLKTDKKYKGIFWDNGPKNIDLKKEICLVNNFDNPPQLAKSILKSNFAFSGNNVTYVSANHKYGAEYKILLDSLFKKVGKDTIVIKAQAMVRAQNTKSNLIIALETLNSVKPLHWYSVNVNNRINNSSANWTKIESDQYTLTVTDTLQKALKIYPLYLDGDTSFFDDIGIRLINK
ncbi:MAG: hypothetical protein A3K10_07695, partial [Bacteroidetes bacterium RIFCSPLOWO2_12_FULL_31_6]